jgi:predicted metal-dependent hydrolase
MMRTPPLRLRNHLAEIILTALGDPAARRQLDAQDFEWLGEATEEQAAIVSARARRASEALAGCPAMRSEPSLDEVLAAAAALFDAGLYFEVHELLEAYWMRAAGAERQALQGLIQIAVAFQHRDNGNLEGARSLLVDGSARLRDGRLPGLDLDDFAEASGAAATRLSDPITVPPFPRAN